jgi:hypothetical protein
MSPADGDADATLLSVVERVLADRGWEYEPLAQRAGVVRFPFQGDEERWMVFVEAQEDDARVLVYSVAPFNVPEERRQAVAEYVTRANYGLEIGNLELDFADGEVRFKTSLDAKGSRLDARLVERAVVMNLHAMNTYVPGVAELVGDDAASPAGVVERIESGA